MMHCTHYKQRKVGFSLIELLVVISIIGIIATFAYVSFGEARAQARDDVRKSDLKQLQLAIELYKAQNGKYPEMGCGQENDSIAMWVGPGQSTAAWVTECANYIVGLVPDYIGELPTDPAFEDEDNRGYMYQTFQDRTEYKLMAHMVVESKLVDDFSHPFARCPQSSGTGSFCNASPQENTYAVYSGARFK